MLLYKYRSLENFEYVLDIILNERLHCAPYDDLNDPFEGIFRSSYTIKAFSEPVLGSPHATLGDMKSPRLLHPRLLHCPNGVEVTNHHHVKEACFEREINKICSLSATLSEVRLWSYYADGHKGVAFELEIPEETPSLHKVVYSRTLPEFSGTVLGAPYSHEVLSHKTSHWEYEQEYRIISEDSFFLLPGKIKAIYLGERVSNSRRALLEKVLNGKFPLLRTKINKSEISVEPTPHSI